MFEEKTKESGEIVRWNKPIKQTCYAYRNRRRPKLQYGKDPAMGTRITFYSYALLRLLNNGLD